MKPEKSILYTNKVATHLEYYSELIVDASFCLDKVKWSNYHDSEIGFYIKDQKHKSTIFFGMWFSVWKQFEIPLCIAIYNWDENQTDLYRKVDQLVKAKSDSLLIYKNFDEHSVILIDESYLTHENDDERIADLLLEVADIFGLHY
jgi:hypothetical protein